MSPSSWRIEVGDCRDVLRSMPECSVHTCVCSPPYFGLRDYGTGEWEGGDPACEHKNTNARQDHSLGTMLGTRGVQGASAAAVTPMRSTCARCGARRVDRQIGLEQTPDEFVAALVEVFREVRRVLRDDGTVWLNLGDSYAGALSTSAPRPGVVIGEGGDGHGSRNRNGVTGAHGAKPKDLLGIPWMVAFALRADGWYLRSDIVWSKPNPMPESVTDRPTKAHEYVFLLSKGPRYFYDADAIREEAEYGRRDWAGGADEVLGSVTGARANGAAGDVRADTVGARTVSGGDPSAGRNRRSVWTVATQPYANAHFATYPPKLIEPCILAGAPERACGECGAPWMRVVGKDCECGAVVPANAKQCPTCGKRNVEWADGRVTDAVFGIDETGSTPGRAAPRKPGSMGQAITSSRGFEPSCSHGDGSAAGVVLDPFAGAGTTGMVALRYGRSFVGIELNPEYAAMARTRIETAVRLGFRAPQNGPQQIPGQASIFDLGGAT